MDTSLTVCSDTLYVTVSENSTHVDDHDYHGILPDDFRFNQNYPNPFNPETLLRFTLPSSGNVSLNVYNAKGQMIKSLIEMDMMAGNHNVLWMGDNDKGEKMSSGVYLFVLKWNQSVQMIKGLLVK